MSEENGNAAAQVNGHSIGWDARNWWRDLQPNPERKQAPRGNPAALAKLRRASTWAEAASIPETIALFQILRRRGIEKLERVATLAAILAHVREEGSGPIASNIGKAPNDKETQAVLSELRLGRLLNVAGDDEILIAFRRLVALMGKTANVADLAEQVLFWDHPETGERRRVRFAFNYWKAGDAAPSSAAPSAE
jgi:CRISPR system Cascade subunit CasB